MLTRVLTGVILAPLVVAATWFYPDTITFGLVILSSLASAWELLSMTSVRKNGPLFIAALAASIALPAVAGFAPDKAIWFWALTPLIFLSTTLLAPQRIPTAFHELGAAALAVVYVAGLTSFVARIATFHDGSTPTGAVPLLMLFAMVWMGDTGAYFGGKSMGRHRLYPAVSPKKTMEGSLWGLVGSVGGGALVHALATSTLSWTTVIVLGVLVGIAEQVGDLCESVLKRSAGVKDSGTLLPGHGGMLDRVDGLLFAAPFVYFAFVL